MQSAPTRSRSARFRPRLWAGGFVFVALVLLTVPGPARMDAAVTQQQLHDLNSGLARQAASAVETFSAADIIATGEFHYDNPGPDDVDFSTYKLPYRHDLARDTGRVQPFFQGYVGYFSLEEKVNELGPPTGRLQVRSVSATAGGGVEWRVTDWLSASPRLLAGYSHIWQDYDREVPASDPTAGLIVDWDVDALTVLPAFELGTHWTLGRWHLGLRSSYTFIKVLDLHSSSSLVEVASDNHVWRNEVSARYDSRWTVGRMPVSFTGLFARHELWGELRRSQFVDFFHEVRGGIVFNVADRLKIVRELGVTGAYYFEGPLTGYSVGLTMAF